MALSLWDDIIHAEGASMLAASKRFSVIAALRVLVEPLEASHSLHGEMRIYCLIRCTQRLFNCRVGRTENAQQLETIIHSKSYFSFMPSSPSSSKIATATIVEILNTATEDNFSVKGNMTLPTAPQSFFYMSCPSCFRHTTSTAQTMFTCHHCNMKQQATPRTKFTVIVSDFLTQIPFVAFGEVAERVAEQTAVALTVRTNKKQFSNIAFEDEIKDALSPPDVNNYLVSEDLGIKNPLVMMEWLMLRWKGN